MGGEGVLTRDEIQDIINIANDIAEHTRLGKFRGRSYALHYHKLKV